jgi:antitoxin MazE
MKALLRKVGNSQGVIIPKPILIQLGLEAEVDMIVENDTILLKKPRKRIREGWSEASQLIAAAGDDTLIFPYLDIEGDSEWSW